MIKLKANLKGIPFCIYINGKEVVYEDHKGEKTQWFPPKDKKVYANLTKEEYAEWLNARTEDEVCRIIKMDLTKNSCKIIEEIKT